MMLKSASASSMPSLIHVRYLKPCPKETACYFFLKHIPSSTYVQLNAITNGIISHLQQCPTVVGTNLCKMFLLNISFLRSILGLNSLFCFVSFNYLYCSVLQLPS